VGLGPALPVSNFGPDRPERTTASPPGEAPPVRPMGAPAVPLFCAPIQAAEARGPLIQLPDWKLVGAYLQLHESDAFMLGQGTYGKVYAAFDTKNDCPKAVKVVPLSEAWRLVASVAEVLSLQHLPSHPNLVKGELLHRPASISTPGALLIVMPRCTGTVSSYLRKNNAMAFSAQTRQKGAIPPATCAAFSSDLLSAVRHLHFHGVVHGDLSPNNLLVFLTENHRAVLRVGDFRTSRVVQGWKGEAPPRTPIRGLPGGHSTFSYSAPENLPETPGGQVGFPIDDWSVGALISEWHLGWWWTRPHGYNTWTREDWVKCQGSILQGALHELQHRAPELEPAAVGALCQLLEVNPLQRASVCDVVTRLGHGATAPPECSTPLLLGSLGSELAPVKSPAARARKAGVMNSRKAVPAANLHHSSASPHCPSGPDRSSRQGSRWVRLQPADVSEEMCKCTGHCSTNCPARRPRRVFGQSVRQTCTNMQSPGSAMCNSCRCGEPGCNKVRRQGEAFCGRHGLQLVTAASPERGVPPAPLSCRAGTSTGSGAQAPEDSAGPAPDPISGPRCLPTVEEMASLFKRHATSGVTPDFFPEGGRLLVLRPHVAARTVLSSPGEVLLGYPPPRDAIGHPWLVAARCCRLALGRATLHSVTPLKGPPWYHWEAQAHSEDPKRAASWSPWYLWKFLEPQPFPCPQICPPFGAVKYITAQQWASRATPEDTQDSPELEKAREGAARAIAHLLSPWAGPGPGGCLPTPATPGPDQPRSTRHRRHPRKTKDMKDGGQGTGKGQKGHAAQDQTRERAKPAGRKRKAERPDLEQTPAGSHAGKVRRQGDPGPRAKAAGQGEEGTSNSSSAHSPAAAQQPVTGAGKGGLPAPGQSPPAGAMPGGHGLRPGPTRSAISRLLPDVSLSRRAGQVFKLLHAITLVKQFLTPTDLVSFVGLHPQTMDNLALQALVLRWERLRHRDAAAQWCHVTLDYRMNHVTGIATWCQRQNLVSAVPPSAHRDTGVVILAGDDAQFLEALLPRSGPRGKRSSRCTCLLYASGMARADSGAC